MDLDFLFLEYDHGKAVAVVEYKHERAELQFPAHPTYMALCDLGTRAGLPVFAVRYADDFAWWRVSPLNEIAKQWVPSRTEMNEQEYVALLYRVRGRLVPERLFMDWDMAV